MATTLANLRANTRQRLGLTADDGMLTDASLTTTLNNALRKMAIEYTWPWLVAEDTFSTVVGQNAYNPPAAWVKTMWVKIDDNELTSRQRLDLVQHDLETGVPSSFAIYKQQLYLSPQPDSVYSVTHAYFKEENTLAADGDTVVCPDRFCDLIVVYASIEEARRQKDSGLEASLLDDKKEWIRNISKLVPEVDILPRVKVRRDFPFGS